MISFLLFFFFKKYFLYLIHFLFFLGNLTSDITFRKLTIFLKNSFSKTMYCGFTQDESMISYDIICYHFFWQAKKMILHLKDTNII